MKFTDTLQQAFGVLVDTAAKVFVAKNTPKAPTNEPAVMPQPAALPPATAATAAAPTWLVWAGVGAVALVGVALILRRR